MSKILKTSCGCHIWLGTTNKEGYGGIRRNGKTIGAHRWFWQEANGPIPDGLCVCHKCDIPSCVNPKHMFLGTHKDNMDDRQSKGRTASQAGRRFTDAHKSNIGAALRGRIFSEESRRKMSESAKKRRSK